MKNRSFLLLLSLLAFAATAGRAYASSFDFSYTFDSDGTTVTGSLDGTADGQFIDNVSNVSLAIDGTAVTGAIYLSMVDSDLFSYDPGAVLSFDVTQNNFVFADSDLANGDYSADSLFSIAYDSAGAALNYSGTQDFPASATWSVTPVAASVPDTGATLALLGLALVGMTLSRRFRLVASAA